MNKKIVFIHFIAGVFLFLFINTAFCFEQVITIPAESPEGVVMDLEPGDYYVEISAGAIALSYPINPNYCWLIGVAVGVDTKGGQDEPNLGTIYFEPQPPILTQSSAEEAALSAVKNKVAGTYLHFNLAKRGKVRFWVSDFDYSDNSGMIKLRVTR